MSKEKEKENWSDKEYVLDRVKNDGRALQYASEELRANKEIVLAAIKKAEYPGWALKYASEELRANKEILLEAVKNDGEALNFASEELRANKEIVLAAVNVNGDVLEYASKELQADKEVVLCAIKECGYALNFASEEFQADKDIVMMAISTYVPAIDCASEELRRDKEIIQKIITILKSYTHKELAEDEYLYTFLLNEFFSDIVGEFWGDKEIVLDLTKICSVAILCVSKELQLDTDVIFSAMDTYVIDREYHSTDVYLSFDGGELSNNKEFVLKAVARDGMYLDYASMEFLEDKEVVLAAVKNNGLALQFASEELRADPEIINAAVKNYPEAIHFKLESKKGITKKGIYETIDNAYNSFKNDNPVLELVCDKNTMKIWYDFMTWFYVNDDIQKEEFEFNGQCSLGDSDIELVISPLMQCAMDESAAWWNKYLMTSHYCTAYREFKESCFFCFGDGCEHCDYEGFDEQLCEANVHRIFREIRDSIDTSSFKELSKIKI